MLKINFENIVKTKLIFLLLNLSQYKDGIYLFPFFLGTVKFLIVSNIFLDLLFKYNTKVHLQLYV